MSGLKSSFRVWWQVPRKASDRQDERAVTFLELFYDLVYVVIIAELAHALAAHPDPKGIAAFGFLFVIVWWAWINGAIYHDLHGNNDTEGARTEQFPSQAHAIWVKHATLSPWPRETMAAVQDYASKTHLQGPLVYSEWMKMANRLREADVAYHGPALDALAKGFRREPDTLGAQHRGSVGREIIHATRFDRVDPRANTRERHDQQIQDESGIDSRPQQRGSVCPSEDIDALRRIRLLRLRRGLRRRGVLQRRRAM